jgi:hypothetical protein
MLTLKPYDVDKEKNLTPNRMLKIKENLQQKLYDTITSVNLSKAPATEAQTHKIGELRFQLRSLPW